MRESELQPTPGGGLTYDDLLRLPEDHLRHELIDGAHYVSPAPGTVHQRVILNIATTLAAHLEEHPLGEVFVAPYAVVFDDVNKVEPDLLYVSHARAARLQTDRDLRGAPELIVEVSSPATHRYDRIVKRALYERCGVTEYWFVDTEWSTLTIYRRAGDSGFAPPFYNDDPDTEISTPLLPALRVPLRTFFKSPRR